MTEVNIHQVVLWLCDLCLDGAGGECHVPGCAMYLNRAPDLSLRDHVQQAADEIEYLRHALLQFRSKAIVLAAAIGDAQTFFERKSVLLCMAIERETRNLPGATS